MLWMKRKAIAYYRVSTDKQGLRGLGMDAQRSTVKAFLGDDWELIQEFAEVETGKRDDRPQFELAKAMCRKRGATLVIAKLDRLSRNAAFLMGLRDAGLDFICCDMPQADKFTIGLFALLAERERDLISQRTKVALVEARKRGTKLGNPRLPDATLRATVARALRRSLLRPSACPG